MNAIRISVLFLFLLAGLLPACAKDQRRPVAANRTEPLPKVIVVKTDQKSIGAGKLLFMQRCEHCHNAYSTKKLVGPGLKGILKNQVLPVSGKPAVPENIENQLRHPNTSMPSFVSLSDEDVQNIISFLNTL